MNEKEKALVGVQYLLVMLAKIRIGISFTLSKFSVSKYSKEKIIVMGKYKLLSAVKLNFLEVILSPSSLTVDGKDTKPEEEEKKTVRDLCYPLTFSLDNEESITIQIDKLITDYSLRIGLSPSPFSIPSRGEKRGVIYQLDSLTTLIITESGTCSVYSPNFAERKDLSSFPDIIGLDKENQGYVLMKIPVNPFSLARLTNTLPSKSPELIKKLEYYLSRGIYVEEKYIIGDYIIPPL